MKLTELLASIAIIGLLAAMLGPRVAEAKRAILTTLGNVCIQHNERIEYLASGCLEDPKGHHTTEKDVDDSTRYFATIDLR